MSEAPRVAILGIHLEASAFVRPTTREDFLAECWEEGEAISRLARQTSNLPSEIPGFYARMDTTGAWTPIPIILLAAQPGGPIVQSVFDDFMKRMQAGLRAALPVDAVYVCNHGGSSTTEDDDNDGTVVSRVREIVGANVPIVVTHDLHCNVSERLVDAVDAMISYRTNPHVDQRERAAEAADLLRRMMRGLKTKKAFIRLPMAPHGITYLMDGPYGDLIRLGQRLTKPPILNVSVTAGYVLTDLPKCGMTVNVTSENDQAAADRVARQIAGTAWENRHRFVRELTSIEKAIAFAREAGDGRREPIFLADLGDNPGGGAPGNTTFMIRALHEAGARGVVLGLLTDPQLAREAIDVGEGGRFHAVFNRVEATFAKRFEAPATVLRMSDGKAVGRRGRDAGRQIVLGMSALLQLEGSGLRVAVTSLREQLADPMMLEMFGVDIGAARCVVGKTRGHFRAGFDEFFSNDRIFEVNTPGPTSAVLTDYEFKKLPRPIWPLDADMTWTDPRSQLTPA